MGALFAKYVQNAPLNNCKEVGIDGMVYCLCESKCPIELHSVVPPVQILKVRTGHVTSTEANDQYFICE